MGSWLDLPLMTEAEANRRAALVYRLLTAIAVLALLAAASSFLNPQNDVRVTVAFYLTVLVWLAVAALMVRRGRVIAAGWAMGLFFWVLIAMVTLWFGGMQGQNASTFAGAVLLLGSVVGGKAALLMAFASSIWCALVVYLELHGLLPKPIVAYHPINAWGALSATVLLTSVLLKESLSSLRRVHEHAEQAARERDEALRRSIQGQKMELVGNVSSGIAHDFNNLLTVVSSASATLRRAVPAGNEASEALDDLDEATNRATLMTRQLLSLGRSNVGEPEYVNLCELVRSLGKMLPRLLGSSIQIQVDVPPEGWVFASKVGLQQIMLNLAVNARDAMPTGGQFKLKVQLTEDHVELVASDTGIGMTSEVMKRVFEPFYSTKSTGTGLGLSTVQRQVEQAQGTISVESSPGVGTSFVIGFPKGDPRAEEVSSPDSFGPHRAAVGFHGRLVLVEDEALVRKVTSRVLRTAGYEVISFADGKEAMAFFSAAGTVDCVVTDISMPRMNGDDLAQHLATSRPDLPVVMVSGNREPHPGWLDHPRRRYLAKPVEADLLLSTIAQLIAPSRRPP